MRRPLLSLTLAARLLHLASGAAAAPSCQVRPARLRTNGLRVPLGVASARPRLSWALEALPGSSAAPRNQTQSAYRILVSSEPVGQADLWDSGRIPSRETLQVRYAGRPLRSAQQVHWRVTVWDGEGVECETSDLTWFETALLSDEDWQGAAWLSRFAGGDRPACDYFEDGDRNSAPRFRAEFVVPYDTLRVRAYITGLGYYQLYVNGQRIGDSVLDPGWTSYNETVLYAVHDISLWQFSDVKGNESCCPPTQSGHRAAVGVELGNGWWNPVPLLFWGTKSLRDRLPVGEPMFRLLVLAEMADRSIRVLLKSTPGSGFGWRTSGSPTTLNSIYLGEHYDARLEPHFEGWARAGYDDSSWPEAVVADGPPAGRLVAQEAPPVRRQEALVPRLLSASSAAEDGSKTLVLDAGKNSAGMCQYNLTGRSGDVVSMVYGELLHTNGSVNPLTAVAGQIKGFNRKMPCQPTVALQEDQVTLSGRSDGDTWAASWAWHGFRFIEVTLPSGAEVNSVTCYPVRSDVDRVSDFSSSDPFLEELSTLARNTFDSNMISVQSDCPGRERFGYGGDALGSGEAGLAIYDWSTFYAKRVRDYNDAQRHNASGDAVGFPETAPFVGIATAGLGDDSGPIGWMAFQPVAQLWLYRYYGDVEIMEESFNATYSFIQLLDRTEPGSEGGLGDWLAVESTSTKLTGLGFHRMCYLAFANITEILGMPDVARKYRERAEAIVLDLNAEFLDPTTGAYSAWVAPRSSQEQVQLGHPLLQSNATQCGQGMALFEDIVPSDLREKAAAVMAENARAASNLPNACREEPTIPASCAGKTGGPGPHLTAGLFGIKWFLMSLADAGLNDLAYEVVTTRTFPGYGFMMHNEFANATTIWESFSFSNSRYSHNHPMFGSTQVWLLQAVAGIQPHPAARGMDKIIIRPCPPKGLAWAKGHLDTPRGRVATSWAWGGGAGEFHLNVTVPPNVAATVHVPSAGGMEVTEGGHPWGEEAGRRISAPGGRAPVFVVEVGSGDYSFRSVAETEIWI